HRRSAMVLWAGMQTKRCGQRGVSGQGTPAGARFCLLIRLHRFRLRRRGVSLGEDLGVVSLTETNCLLSLAVAADRWREMAEEIERPAWLEQTNIGRVEISGTCSIGRAPSNQVVLMDDKVSRRHAVIHAQDVEEFWLVDLGSSNGTYLN